MANIIVSYVNGRADSSDLHLQELAYIGNTKQCLNVIEKRLKKGKNARLLTNKFLVLQESKQEADHKRSLEVLRDVANNYSQAVTSDLEVLRAIEAAAAEADELPEVRQISDKLWAAAIKARPNDEEFLQEAFKQKLGSFNYDAAKKIAQASMKSKVVWYYRYLLCLFMLATSTASTATALEKGMYEKLVIQSLHKSAKEVEPDITKTENEKPIKTKQTPALTSRALRNSENVEFLVEIFRRMGKLKEVDEILSDNERAGLGSSIGTTWDLALSKIEIMSELENWDGVWDLCMSILNTARKSKAEEEVTESLVNFGALGDDWAVWKALIKAAHRSKKEEHLKKTETLIGQFETLSNRHHLLAKVEVEGQASAVGSGDPERFLEACKSYFKTFVGNQFLFPDLMITRLLPETQKADFIQFTKDHAVSLSSEMQDTPSERKWISAEITSLKLEYYLFLSHTAAQPDTSAIEELVSTCLRLYASSLELFPELSGSEKSTAKEDVTERRAGDDAAILAAMALVRLSSHSGHQNALHRAALVLDHLLAHSKYNYDAILLSVRIYFLLGMGGRALELFATLDVKNLQNVNVSWVILTRLSTTFPCAPVKASKARNPAELLGTSKKWMVKTYNNMGTAFARYLNEDAIRNLLDALQTFETFDAAASSVILFSEIERVKWGADAGIVEPFCALKLPSEVTDLREKSIIPSYEAYGERTMEEILRAGPLPMRNWAKLQMRCSWFRLVFKQPDMVADKELVEKVWGGSDCKKVGLNADDELTQDEMNLWSFMTLAQVALEKTMVSFASGSRREEAVSLVENFISAARHVFGCKTPIEQALEDLQRDRPSFTSFSWLTFHEMWSLVARASITGSLLPWLTKMEKENGKPLGSDKTWLETQSKAVVAEAKSFCAKLRADSRELQGVLKSNKTADAMNEFIKRSGSDSAGSLNKAIADDLLGDKDTIKERAVAMTREWVDSLHGVEQYAFGWL